MGVIFIAQMCTCILYFSVADADKPTCSTLLGSDAFSIHSLKHRPLIGDLKATKIWNEYRDALRIFSQQINPPFWGRRQWRRRSPPWARTSSPNCRLWVERLFAVEFWMRGPMFEAISGASYLESPDAKNHVKLWFLTSPRWILLPQKDAKPWKKNDVFERFAPKNMAVTWFLVGQALS